MIIYDFWGKPREFDPEKYVRKHFDPKDIGDYFIFYPREVLKEEFGICGDEQVRMFWRDASLSDRYLYDNMVIEIEYAAGRRTENGHHRNAPYTERDIEDALDRCLELGCDIIAHQYAALEHMCFSVDEASLRAMPHTSIFKAMIYTYVVCVLRLAPGIALEASKSADALSYLKRWGLSDNSAFAEAIEKRVSKWPK